MMHRVHRRLLTHGALAAALLAVACKPAERADAGDEDSAAAVDSASAEEQQQSSVPSAASTATGAGTTSAEASMTAADVDRWQRGMVGELAAVREAETKLKAAKTGNDTLSAMMSADETSTRAAGARAAGLDEERYNVVRATLAPLAAYLAPIELEMNVKDAPPALLAQMKKGREQSLANASAGVPPAVIDALRPRAAELRKQDLALVGERLRVAGLAR